MGACASKNSTQSGVTSEKRSSQHSTKTIQPQINSVILQKKASLGSIQLDLLGVQGDTNPNWVYIPQLKCYYLGEWKNNKMHGKGQLFNPAEQKLIIGLFIDGAIVENKGRIINKQGLCYEGPMDNNFEPKGRGICRYYQKGLRHGQGLEKSGEYVFEGMFEFGKKIKGKLTDSKGIYQGQFVDGKKSGFGVYTWIQGGKYVGYFLDDKKHGRGSLYDADGNLVRKGEWFEDQMMR